ncbi:MAG: hypothetical protein H6668_16355 [Ardenticatenaceae bacterium]|nr:hypothetical protein [Ardenticatenaceae bacterium]
MSPLFCLAELNGRSLRSLPLAIPPSGSTLTWPLVPGRRTGRPGAVADSGVMSQPLCQDGRNGRFLCSPPSSLA